MADVGFERCYAVTGRDFANAGRVSTGIKDVLKEMGIRADLVRRVAIACYEAEMNAVMYAYRASLTLRVTPEAVAIEVQDIGPGIEDINLAMQEGYSTATHEMREMGFGAGMGLPNMRKNADEFKIRSQVDRGTQLFIRVNLN